MQVGVDFAEQEEGHGQNADQADKLDGLVKHGVAVEGAVEWRNGDGAGLAVRGCDLNLVEGTCIVWLVLLHF